MSRDSLPGNLLARMRHASDLSLEVVVLLILGAFMLLFGVLLLAIKDGALPYTRDSAYGVFLVLVSFQTITMGKSPFGDLHRSWGLIIMGLGTGTFGMAACFIPGYLTEAIRVLVGLILSLGGPTLTVRLMASQGARKAWAGGSGMLKQLVVSCLLVYGLSFATGLITLFPGILGDGQTALLLICYGLAFSISLGASGGWPESRAPTGMPSRPKARPGAAAPRPDGAPSFSRKLPCLFRRPCC